MSRSPAAARRRLGSELKALREQADLTIEEAAGSLYCSTATVGRLENGKGVPQLRDVRDLVALYGVGIRPDLMDLAVDGRNRAWWFRVLPALRREASHDQRQVVFGPGSVTPGHLGRRAGGRAQNCGPGEHSPSADVVDTMLCPDRVVDSVSAPRGGAPMTRPECWLQYFANRDLVEGLNSFIKNLLVVGCLPLSLILLILTAALMLIGAVPPSVGGVIGTVGAGASLTGLGLAVRWGWKRVVQRRPPADRSSRSDSDKQGETDQAT